MINHRQKKKDKAADCRRGDNVLDPRGLGRRVGDAILVGDCWAICIYCLPLYQEISSVASAWGWVFMVFAVLYVLLVVKCLWTWKTMATAFTKQQQADKDKDQGRLTRSKSAIERAKQAAGNAKNVYEKLQINGEWFCGSCMLPSCLSRRNSVSTWSRCIYALCRWVGPLAYVLGSRSSVFIQRGQ